MLLGPDQIRRTGGQCANCSFLSKRGPHTHTSTQAHTRVRCRRIGMTGVIQCTKKCNAYKQRSGRRG